MHTKFGEKDGGMKSLGDTGLEDRGDELLILRQCWKCRASRLEAATCSLESCEIGSFVLNSVEFLCSGSQV